MLRRLPFRSARFVISTVVLHVPYIVISTAVPPLPLLSFRPQCRKARSGEIFPFATSRPLGLRSGWHGCGGTRTRGDIDVGACMLGVTRDMPLEKKTPKHTPLWRRVSGFLNWWICLWQMRTLYAEILFALPQSFDATLDATSRYWWRWGELNSFPNRNKSGFLQA